MITSDEAFKVAKFTVPVHDVADSDLQHIWNAALKWAATQQEPVAWVRRHPDGALTNQFLENEVIEPVRKKSGAWLPLYTHATPAQPVASSKMEHTTQGEVLTVEAFRKQFFEVAEKALFDVLINGTGVLKVDSHVPVSELYPDEPIQLVQEPVEIQPTVRPPLQHMTHSALRNYVVPGLTSELIGGDGHGCVRLFRSEVAQQQAVTPHSHRFDFSCLVLKGSVTNRIWTDCPSGDLFQISSLAYGSEPGHYTKKEYSRSRFDYKDHIHQAGQWYSMRSHEIHSIFFSRGAEVLVFEGPNITNESVILEPVIDDQTIKTFQVQPWMFKKGEVQA